MTERIGLEAILATKGFQAGLDIYLGGIAKMQGTTASAATSVSASMGNAGDAILKASSAMGQMAITAGGVVAADIFNRLASGLGAFVSSGLDAVNQAQKLEAGLGALLTSNNLYERSVQQVQVAVGDFAKEQAKAVETSSDLAFAQKELTARIDKQKASIQEQRQRVIDLTAKWGEQGLATKEAAAQLGVMEVSLEGMQRDLAKTGQEQGKLNSLTQEYTTVTKTSFEQVMGFADAQGLAAKQTQELLAFVDKLAITSPFEADQVAQITKYAVGAGLAVDETKAFTSGFLDLAAAVGIGSDSLAFASDQLLQVAKVGKLTEIDLRQLRRLGIDLEKIIGVEMKMSVDEFNAEAEKSPEIFNELFNAVTTFSQKTFPGASQKLTTSIEGIGSTLHDIFTVSAKNLLRPMIDAAGPAASEMLGKIAAFATGPELIKIGESISRVLFGAFQSLSGGGEGELFAGLKGLGLDSSTAKNITDITGSIRELFEIFQTSGFTGLAQYFGIPPEVLATITEINAQITGLLDAFATSGFTGLSQALGIPPEVIAGITAAADEFQRLMDVFAGGAEGGGAGGGFSAIFDDLKAQIAEALPQLAADIMTGIPAALTAVTDAIGEHFRTNVPAFQEIMAEWGPKFWEWTNTIIDGAGTALTGIIVSITAWATSAESQASLNTTGSEIGKSIVTGIGLLFENSEELSKVLLKLSGGLLLGVAVLAGDLIIIGGQLVAGITSGILKALGIDLEPATFDELSTILGNIGRDGAIIAEHAAVAIAKGFEKLGDAIINAFIPGFSKLKSKIKPYFEDTFKEAKDIFSVDKWFELGESIILGIEEGIKKNQDLVLEMLKSLAANALQAAKEAIGYGSPAAAFIPLGASVPQGIAVGINNAAGLATQAIQGMGRNLLTSTSSALDFIDDLDMGGLAKGFGTGGGQWRNFRNILKNEIMGGMGALADGTADVMDSVYKVAARFNFPPAMAAEFAEANGLVEHLTGNFEKFRQQMNIENMGNLLGMGGSFSGIAGTLADMLQAQMGNADEANKTVETYKKLSDQVDTSKNKLATLQQELEVLTTSEGAHQIALDKKNLAIEKTTEAIEFNRRQLEIYEQELAGMQEGTLAWDKKKLSIDKTTEAIDSQSKQLITLKEELEKLDVANNADTLSIEKKRLEIEKLTAEMAKNQQAVIAAREDFEALATGSAADQIAFLQSFLESGADSIRLIGEELGGMFAGTGLTSDVYWTRVAAQERLAELLEEQRRQEELITQQKEAQGKLDKLKAQLDLINLGRQLGGDIFAGINFGLDASIEDLLAATNAVTMAMVDQINHDLQIHSPSGVMIKTFEQVMAGAAFGVRRGESMLSDAVRSIPILNGSMPQFSQAAGISNSSTYNYNFPMTVNTAATAQGVVRQYDVRRSLANV